MRYFRLLAAAALGAVLATTLAAQDDPAETEPRLEPPMTVERLEEVVRALDAEAVRRGPTLELTISDIPVLIVTDIRADRMRTMVPIRSSEGMTEDELRRLMQANFDSALDARYAIANGRLWATFIHPLSPLEKNQLISGLGQTVNLALTYGTLYSSGALQFGGGDSPGLQRQLIDELLEKGEEI